MKKKSLFKLLASTCLVMALLATSLLGACAGVPAAEVRFTVGLQDTPSTLNPFAAERTYQAILQCPMMETLLLNMEDATHEPSLAKSWEVSADNLTWTLYLEENVEWSDGEPFTADDVLFTYQTQWAHPVWAQARACVVLVVQAEADTASTVSLEFKDNDPAADTIVRTTGSFITDGWESGESVKVSDSADNDGTYLIDTVTALVLTLDKAVALTDEGPATGATLTADGPALDALVKVDDHTVKFTLSDTFGTFLSSLGAVWIIPEHIWAPIIASEDIETYEPMDEDIDAAAVLIGTGPFLFEEYVTDTYASFNVNPNYWRGAPEIDKLVYKYYGTSEAAILALRAGEIDAIDRLASPTQVPLLLQESAITVDMVTSYNNSECMWFNMRYKPFNELKVRQAINLAIDRQDIIDFAVHGYGSLPQMVPFAGGLDDANPDVAWPGAAYADMDHAELVAAANALLDQVDGISDMPTEPGAGWVRTYTNPVTDITVAMEYTLTLYIGPVYLRVGELVVDDLLEIGIKTNIEVTPSIGPLWFSGMQVWQWDLGIFGYPQAADFDELVKQWGNQPFGANYDGGVCGLLNDPTRGPGTEGAKPQTWETPYVSPTEDQLAEYLALYNELVALSEPVTAALIATRTEFVEADRHQAALDAQVIFLNAMPTVVLYHNWHLSAYRTDRFEGWGEPEGAFYYGYIPGAVAPRTLLTLSPK